MKNFIFINPGCQISPTVLSVSEVLSVSDSVIMEETIITRNGRYYVLLLYMYLLLCEPRLKFYFKKSILQNPPGREIASGVL